MSGTTYLKTILRVVLSTAKDLDAKTRQGLMTSIICQYLSEKRFVNSPRSVQVGFIDGRNVYRVVENIF
jgi:hypothetical protein